MFDSGVIGLAIGLVLIYFLFSLISSGVNEVIEAILKRRAKFLEAGIYDLLGPELKLRLYQHQLIRSLRSQKGLPKRFGATTPRDQPRLPSYIPSRTFANALLSIVTDPFTRLLVPIPEHQAKGPAVEVEVSGSIGLFPSPPFQVKVESNEVQAETFLVTAIQKPADGAERWTLQPTKAGPVYPMGSVVSKVRTDVPDAGRLFADAKRIVGDIELGPVREALSSLLTEAASDLDRWRTAAETWFDAKMDRVSGWYKRQTRWFLLAIGLFVVLAANADTLVFARVLWTNAALRESVVNTATRIVTPQPTPTPTPCPFVSPSPGEDSTSVDPLVCLQQRIEDLKGLGLPLGWSLNRGDYTRAINPDPRLPHNWWPGAAFKILGLLITAFALMLGAQFWFDLLNKLVNFRSSGTPPPSTTAQPKVPLS